MNNISHNSVSNCTYGHHYLTNIMGVEGGGCKCHGIMKKKHLLYITTK